MLFALITSMVTVALLSSNSMGIENTVYGSASPQQDEESTGEESTGEVQNNSSSSDNLSMGNNLPEVNSNSTLITIGCTLGMDTTPIALTRFVYHLMEAKNLKELSPVQLLGCPYNPPNPNANQPIGSGNSLTK